MTDPRLPLNINRRQFLQGAGALVTAAALGLELEPALAAPPAVPRNTAFLQWIGAQTKKPARFSFAVVGDNRPNTKVFDQIAAKTNSERPAFVVHVGDIVEGGTADQWNRVSPSLQAFAAPMIATLGNHDRHLKGPKGRDMQLWGAEWGSGQWDFIVGGWHFVGFDTSMGHVSKAQQAWLETTLNDNMPTMVMTHYPPSIDRWKVHALYTGTSEFMALLKKHSVEHFFCGHNHMFDQLTVGPTQLTMTAGAGSHLYKQFGFGVLKHHLTRVDVEGDKVSVEMVPI